ncbi:hypothetical protein J421_4643 (plasmid) [Gemmatirosa kalamazoonensis]|uniref:Uncharacterized protein n=1 Tax=Gemmatirosa kalamazoonensis TaxID=861299 RepID=W0RRH6_9BACT|nr:hypothetical protein [Gemmatirosa kalamazoonensis]AHG92110.1 hypothetical protein J421_4575 [Gemmatirosa kalamazoonensis]AHG92178.1 hypothetical protein J421_4643 [Gemmatirosa kalamazoonensis]
MSVLDTTPTPTPNYLLAALRKSASVVSFTARPIPLHADYRPIWRVPLLAITIRLCCHASRTSLTRLHILNWAVRTPSARRELLALLDGKKRPQDVIVRTEPTLNFVVDLALGEKVVSFPRGDRVALTERGIALADEVIQTEDCFEVEKAFFAALGKQLTEEWVGELVKVSFQDRS